MDTWIRFGAGWTERLFLEFLIKRLRKCLAHIKERTWNLYRWELSKFQILYHLAPLSTLKLNSYRWIQPNLYTCWGHHTKSISYFCLTNQNALHVFFYKKQLIRNSRLNFSKVKQQPTRISKAKKLLYFAVLVFPVIHTVSKLNTTVCCHTTLKESTKTRVLCCRLFLFLWISYSQ